ncbi:MAG: cobalamin biosynthesis protein P47K, partial [Acidobacteriota bacterium]
PLRRLYGDHFDIAPLSVMVDPRRAARILGLDGFGLSRAFSSKVTYVYRKQLEEAQVLVINKIDLLDDVQRRTLRRALEAEFPAATVIEVTARDGDGLDVWFDHLDQHSLGHHPVLDIDYTIYAEGEAKLGWLNATLTLDSSTELDGNALVERVARGLLDRLRAIGAEVAHLKMTLAPSIGPGDLALVNLVGSAWVPEVAERLGAPVDAGQLVVNLRAEADPDALARVLDAEIDDRPELRIDHVERFAPAAPNPTHRMTAAS